MTQEERRSYLIEYLLREREDLPYIAVPETSEEQRRLLRSLMNIRPPQPIDADFLRVQDAYLQEETEQKGVVHLAELRPAEPGIYLWQGDITRLAADGIVNAANSALLGCFVPCHGCIDNAIHSAAGVQLRLGCVALMEQQGAEEAAGRAKITPAYNLPSRYVLHTVGPIIQGALRQEDRTLLANCYLSCLELARQQGLQSLAFCCISTGEFRFPNEAAAQIAVETVRAYRQEHKDAPEVIFNVFQDTDHALYQRLLG